MSDAILVYGAYGHTGRFVVAELQRRGWTPIAAGRDRDALTELDRLGVSTRRVTVDEPDDLAGAARRRPSDPQLCRSVRRHGGAAHRRRAARRHPLSRHRRRTRRGGQHVRAVRRRRGGARRRRHACVPASSGRSATSSPRRPRRLALELTASPSHTPSTRWHPTSGTRLAMQRMGDGRLVFRHGQLAVRTTPPPVVEREFPPPFGSRSTSASTRARRAC